MSVNFTLEDLFFFFQRDYIFYLIYFFSFAIEMLRLRSMQARGQLQYHASYIVSSILLHGQVFLFPKNSLVIV